MGRSLECLSCGKLVTIDDDSTCCPECKEPLYMPHVPPRPEPDSVQEEVPQEEVSEEDAAGVMTTITEIWVEMLTGLGVVFGSDESTRHIVENIFVPDRIDPEIFAANYIYLDGGEASLRLFKMDKSTMSCSVADFANPVRRAPTFPLWFIAAYPDVLSWHGEWQAEYIRTHDSSDLSGVPSALAEMFGMDFRNDEDVEDAQGHTRPRYLRNLVVSYRERTGKELETQAGGDSIYGAVYDSSPELRQALGITADNFTLIARNTAKYYMALKPYARRFQNDAGMLMAAGVLDARVYLFAEQSINITQIKEIAHKACLKDNPLLDFIVNLEVLIFCVDCPAFTRAEIEQECRAQERHSQEAIESVVTRYRRAWTVSLEVAAFMKSRKFADLRVQLGIK